MPRFFFHFRQGGTVQRDETGVEFPSSESAYLAAIEAMPGMWSELLAKRQDPRVCGFEIRSAAGQLLFSIPFTELLDACSKEVRPHLALRRNLQDARDTHVLAHRLREELREELKATRRTLRESALLIAQPV